MRSFARLPSVLALALVCSTSAWAAGKSKPASGSDGSKKSGKEISTDDKALDKQMDWETKVLGPNTQKKIDLAKIQKLQAEEMARREKQDRIEQVEKDRKEREAAAAAAAQRNVKAPSTRDVPGVTETPPPAAKPAEKHDDAFVDKLLSGKGEKKKATVSNDEVDQLLDKAKQDKAASIEPPKGKRGKADTVDQLLATADKQASIKTTTKKPNDSGEPVSAEAAAREATLKAIAAAVAAKAEEEKARNRRPAIPDAAMLRAQVTTKSPPAQPAPSSKPAPTRGGWTDPFASDSGSSSRGRGKVVTDTAPPSGRTLAPASGRHSPSTRGGGANDNRGWQDPFDSDGGAAKPRPAPKPAPAARPKRPANWKDPFA